MKIRRVIGVILVGGFAAATYYAATKASFQPLPESRDWVSYAFVNLMFAVISALLVMP